MMGIDLLRPGFVWVLPAAALVWLAWRLWRRKNFVAITTAAWLQPARYHASALRRLPLVLVALAFVSVSIALMDPVLPYSEGQVRSRGLDIVLVLDLSKSMYEPMDSDQGGTRTRARLPVSTQGSTELLPPAKTRLETTKEALRKFVSGRRDDRIGLIVFSEYAYVVSPLTFDYNYLLNYVNMIDDQILRGEGLTAIGDGIAQANYLLAKQSRDERVDKVVLVFTDGVHNVGRDPVEVLPESAEAGTRVHVIGIDLESNLKTAQTVRRLVETVRRYGGRYFDADTPEQLRAASAAIDALERGPLTNKVHIRNAPVFTWFTVPALVLLVLGLALRAVPYFADFT